MKVERIFSPQSKITIKDIVRNLLLEEIDRILDEDYDKNMVNTATSDSKGDDVA
ncbi:MAG: hypothetical protein ACQEV7_10340 [Bacillota bacterium]